MNKIATRCTAAFLCSLFSASALAQFSFAPAATYPAASSPVSVAIGDINGDGKADAVFAVGFANPGKVAIFHGDGTGALTAAPSLNLGGQSAFGIAIGDFNRDGIRDLAVSIAGTAKVAILLGTGGGAFATPVEYAIGSSPGDIAIADFNRDGKADLAIVCQVSDAVSVLLGNGDGTFGAATSVPVGDAPFGIATADFNGDGNPDLVTANSFSGDLSVLLGDGSGGFVAASNVAIASNPVSVVVADFNKDGNADLAVARGVSGAGVGLVLGNGDGTFGAPNFYPATGVLSDLVAADFDGDGNADVAAASTGGSIHVFPGLGGISLSAPVTVAGGGSPRSIAYGDLDGDAKADLVMAGGTAAVVSVLLNNTTFAVTAQTWGTGEAGELGNGVFGANSNLPVDVLNLDAIAAVSAGFQHVLALRADGTAWAWGADWGGALGDGGTSIHSAVPVQVVDYATLTPLANLVAVSAGDDHSLALRADGTLWGWGNNLHGQTGTGFFLHDTHAAWPVPGIDDVVAISAGMAYNLALKADGTVWSWGWNTFGQLGDGMLGIERHSPVQVSGLTNVVAVVASGSGWHSLALKADGTVWAWGRNERGALGDGTTTDRLAPVQVSGLTGVRGIAAGTAHSIAVKADGTVWAWGDNGHGQLGDGTTTQRTVPVQVPSFGGVVAVTTGQTHTVVLKADGTVWSWGGNNWSGQLGDGHFASIDRTSPGQVLNITAATALSTAGQHSVIILKGMTIAAMIHMVQGLNLALGVPNGLVATLSAAQSAQRAGHAMAACAQVGAFGRQVRAFSGKQIPVADADRLLAGSRRLETSLGCRG